MKLLKIAATTVMIMAAFTLQAATVSGFDNTSFETTFDNPRVPTGWYSEQGKVQVWGPGGANEGNLYAFLDSSTTIQQSFTSNYTGMLALSFWVVGSGGVDVYNSVDVGNQHFNNADHSSTSLITVGRTFTTSTLPTPPMTPDIWTQLTYNFSAVSGNSYHVYFDGHDQGMKLDNVSVAAVPEPETYAMLLAGLGVLGFTGRRRMKQS